MRVTALTPSSPLPPAPAAARRPAHRRPGGRGGACVSRPSQGSMLRRQGRRISASRVAPKATSRAARASIWLGGEPHELALPPDRLCRHARRQRREARRNRAACAVPIQRTMACGSRLELLEHAFAAAASRRCARRAPTARGAGPRSRARRRCPRPTPESPSRRRDDARPPMHGPADAAGADDDDAAVLAAMGADAGGMRVGGDQRAAERMRQAARAAARSVGSLAPASARQATMRDRSARESPACARHSPVASSTLAKLSSSPNRMLAGPARPSPSGAPAAVGKPRAASGAAAVNPEKKYCSSKRALRFAAVSTRQDSTPREPKTGSRCVDSDVSQCRTPWTPNAPARAIPASTLGSGRHPRRDDRGPVRRGGRRARRAARHRARRARHGGAASATAAGWSMPAPAPPGGSRCRTAPS